MAGPPGPDTGTTNAQPKGMYRPSWHWLSPVLQAGTMSPEESPDRTTGL